MWICSCHAVSDGMIKEFAKEHGCNWKLMTQTLKCGTQCGVCAKSAKEILEQAAGKPKRVRKARKAADADSAQLNAPANETSPEAVVSSKACASSDPTSVVQDAASGSQSASNSTPPTETKFLPCGKCVCTCGN